MKKIENDSPDIPGEHEFRESLTVDIWYPDHAPRHDSAMFRRTREHLIEDLNTPCWICGSLEEREVHHFHVEWAFADAVDWEEMKRHHPEFDWDIFTQAGDFVDSPYNMMVLCSTHHRARNHGIHNLPYPIWVMQKYRRDDFQMFSEEDEAGPYVWRDPEED